MNYHIRKINHIFQEVYSINESMSDLEREEFIQGFEYGIKMLNEEFLDRFKKEEERGKKTVSDVKKGAGRFGSFVSDKFKKGVSGAKDMFNRGVNKAKEVYQSVKDFSKSVINKASSMVSDAAQYIKDSYDKFLDGVQNTYKFISDKVSEAYKNFKDKSVELLESVKQLVNRVYDKVVSSIQNTIKSIVSTKESFVDWFKENKEILKQKLTQLKNSTIENSRRIANILLGIIVMAPEKIYNALVKAGNAVKSITFIIIGSIQSGIEKSIAFLTEKYEDIKEWVSNKIGQLRDVLGNALISLGEKVKGDSEPGQLDNNYKMLLGKWKEQQKAAGKNTSPGQGTRARLKKQAIAMSESRIVKFEDFVI